MEWRDDRLSVDCIKLRNLLPLIFTTLSETLCDKENRTIRITGCSKIIVNVIVITMFQPYLLQETQNCKNLSRSLVRLQKEKIFVCIIYLSVHGSSWLQLQHQGKMQPFLLLEPSVHFGWVAEPRRWDLPEDRGQQVMRLLRYCFLYCGWTQTK